MKARNVLMLVVIGLPALAMADYQAAPWPAGSPPAGWRPEPYKAGSWFSMERNGAGWAIERLSPLAGETRPLYAGTLYTYDASGRPYWREPWNTWGGRSISGPAQPPSSAAF
jgi:hypothetical protein